MIVVAKLKAKEESQAEVASVLKGLVSMVKQEAGTLAYTLHRSQTDPSVFLFYEKYKDMEALVAHSSTDYFKKGFSALKSLLAEKPVIEMYDELDSI